ncbi:hypothetical protein D9M71_439480 [compost metagenome]
MAVLLGIGEVVEGDAGLQGLVLNDHPIALADAMAGGDNEGGAVGLVVRPAGVDQGAHALPVARQVDAPDSSPVAVFALAIGEQMWFGRGRQVLPVVHGQQGGGERKAQTDGA